MARVTGVLELVHTPMYDAFFSVDDGDGAIFLDSMTDPRMLRFFVDVQNKTRLQTNLQNAGVLPSLNSFEVRAMRVVISKDDEDDPDNEGTGSEFINLFIYNSVTSLIVGEKVMIEVPTFWLPGGSGVQGADGVISNHGVPDPLATFRFAEPVGIEPQQNFRVEILFPEDIPELVGHAQRQAKIWVVLDGLQKRAVQ